MKSVIKIPSGIYLIEQRAESSPLFVNLDTTSQSYGWTYYVNGVDLVTAGKLSASELSSFCVYEYGQKVTNNPQKS